MSFECLPVTPARQRRHSFLLLPEQLRNSPCLTRPAPLPSPCSPRSPFGHRSVPMSVPARRPSPLFAATASKRRAFSEDLHTRIRRLGQASPLSVSIQTNEETCRRQIEVVVHTSCFSRAASAPYVFIVDLRRFVFWMAFMLLCASASAYSVVPNRVVPFSRTPAVRAVAAPAVGVRIGAGIEGEAIEGAKRVREAAKSFGAKQEAAVSEWLEAAFAGGGDGGASLLEQQLALFDECSFGEPGDELRCRAFSESLTSMCAAVADAADLDAAARRDSSPDSSLSARFDELFHRQTDAEAVAAGRVRVAANRVRRASEHFGSEQRASVDEWLARATAGQADTSDGGAELLTQTVPLFECELSEDGSPSKCEELYEAVEGLEGTLGVWHNLTSNQTLLPHLLDEVSGHIGIAARDELGADSFDVYTVSSQLLSLVNNGEFTPDKLRGYFTRACVSTLIHKVVGTASVVLASSGVMHH